MISTSRTHMTKIQSGRPSREYGTGRRCIHPGCGKPLSRYNPEAICSSHTFGKNLRINSKLLQSLKLCPICNEFKPATNMYFRFRRNKLDPQCRECVNAKRRAARAIEWAKTHSRKCSTCGELKPNTAEFFKRFDTGFTAQCKVCANEKKRLHRAAQREEKFGRKCAICGELKPANSNNFNVIGEGLSSQCAACENEIRLRLIATQVEEARALENGLVRKCPVCGIVKPLDAVHWRKYRESSNLSEVCYECLREKWKLGANSGRKKKALQSKES